MVPGAQAFLLYDSFGFPLELTAEIAAERGAAVDVAGFEAAMQEQRRRSKDAAKVLDAPHHMFSPGACSTGAWNGRPAWPTAHYLNDGWPGQLRSETVIEGPASVSLLSLPVHWA